MCKKVEDNAEGALRLRGGFGTLCDPIHSGFVEVLHFGVWGSICESSETQVAKVICRQLGFASGAVVDALDPVPPPDSAAMSSATDYGYYTARDTEEAELPLERIWLRDVTCGGRENRLSDCNLGEGFRRNIAARKPDLNQESTRLHVACQSFPVMGSRGSAEIATPVGGECRPEPLSLLSLPSLLEIYK